MPANQYSEELIIAVKWLLRKGITRSSEIARRLEISPYTARNVKRVLRKRGEFPEQKNGHSVGSRTRKRRGVKKQEDWISKVLGGEKVK